MTWLLKKKLHKAKPWNGQQQLPRPLGNWKKAYWTKRF